MTQFHDWSHSSGGSLSASINGHQCHSFYLMYVFLPRSAATSHYLWSSSILNGCPGRLPWQKPQLPIFPPHGSFPGRLLGDCLTTFLLWCLLCPWDICSSCIYFYSTCNSLVILTFHFISMKTIFALLLEAFNKYFTSIISSWVNLTFKNTLFFIQDNVHPVLFDIHWKSGYIWISWVFILLDCAEIVPD